VCSCAAAPLPPPESGYEEGGVEIAVKADDQLNQSGGRPHTLVLCIYQLATPNVFNQLAGDEDGLYRLLECSLFDPSVASAKRLIVHPGDSTTHTLDRAEGAKYVAVAAGYYQVEKKRMVRLYEIPTVIETKGLIRRTKTKKLDKLKIDLKLGPQQIQ
jgi:type VI secretion system VasD/TssJ family lipoprotein